MTLTDPAERKAYNRAYYLANREKWAPTDESRAAEKRRMKANPGKYYARMLRRQEKQRGVLREAKNHPCVDCGGEYPPWVMDLDHVRGEKEFSIGKLVNGVSTARLLAEINKCDVVCANCHRERTEMARRGGDV